MEITVDALIQNIPEITDFVDEALEVLNVSQRARMQIDVALDELISNVCHYAYEHADKVGKVRVEIEETDDKKAVHIIIKDTGVPFDPLHRDDPDVTLGIEDRKIGGLGIFMVKKIMDDVTYEYVDGRNVLKVRKNK